MTVEGGVKGGQRCCVLLVGMVSFWAMNLQAQAQQEPQPQ